MFYVEINEWTMFYLTKKEVLRHVCYYIKPNKIDICMCAICIRNLFLEADLTHACNNGFSVVDNFMAVSLLHYEGLCYLSCNIIWLLLFRAYIKYMLVVSVIPLKDQRKKKIHVTKLDLGASLTYKSYLFSVI